jgi:hypothetical protein
MLQRVAVVRYTLGPTLLIHRGCRSGVYRGGSHHLELVTRPEALDGLLRAFGDGPNSLDHQCANCLKE